MSIQTEDYVMTDTCPTPVRSRSSSTLSLDLTSLQDPSSHKRKHRKVGGNVLIRVTLSVSICLTVDLVEWT